MMGFGGLSGCWCGAERSGDTLRRMRPYQDHILFEKLPSYVQNPTGAMNLFGRDALKCLRRELDVRAVLSEMPRS